MAIQIVLQVCALCGLLLQVLGDVPIQEGGCLLPGDFPLGGKGGGGHAADNALGFRPGHSLGVVAMVGHVGEGSLPRYLRFPCQAVQRGHQLAAGDGGVGGKMGLVHALHQTVGNDVVGIGMVPAVRIQIHKGLGGTRQVHRQLLGISGLAVVHFPMLHRNGRIGSALQAKGEGGNGAACGNARLAHIAEGHGPGGRHLGGVIAGHRNLLELQGCLIIGQGNHAVVGVHVRTLGILGGDGHGHGLPVLLGNHLGHGGAGAHHLSLQLQGLFQNPGDTDPVCSGPVGLHSIQRCGPHLAANIADTLRCIQFLICIPG